MSIYWYQCRKCGTLVKKESSPSGNCPEGNSHAWEKLAEVGDTNYQCKKCGINIEAKSSPSGHCSEGNTHSWQKI